MPPSAKKAKADKCKGEHTPYVLSDTDIKEMDMISSSFSYEEMSFEAWCELDKDLDLLIPVMLSSQEACDGITKEVSWSRTVEIVQNGEPNRMERQRVTKVITFPPKIEAGWSTLFEGLGDSNNQRRGSAQVIVRIV